MQIKNIKEIISLLKQQYQVSRVQGDPFEILITTLLSQRTRDEKTQKASALLFSYYDSAKKMAEAETMNIEKLIMSVSFYRKKAKKIVALSRILEKTHEGKIPRDLNTLLQLPGVGRKTANSVLIYEYGESALPVDTHIHRVSNRVGLVLTKKPDDTEKIFEKNYPEKILDRNYSIFS